MADVEQLQDLRNLLEQQTVAIGQLRAKSEKADKDKEETAKKIAQLEDALTDQGEFPGQTN